MIQDVAATVVLSGVILLFGKTLLGIFNRDAVILEYGMVRLWFILAAEAVNVVIEVLSGCMRGYAYSFVPAAIAFVGICGVRITWVYTAFRQKPDFKMLMCAYPISWCVTAAAIFIAYLAVITRSLNKIPKNKA